jgi:hypothetical protein
MMGGTDVCVAKGSTASYKVHCNSFDSSASWTVSSYLGNSICSGTAYQGNILHILFYSHHHRAMSLT